MRAALQAELTRRVAERRELLREHQDLLAARYAGHAPAPLDDPELRRINHGLRQCLAAIDRLSATLREKATPAGRLLPELEHVTNPAE